MILILMMTMSVMLIVPIFNIIIIMIIIMIMDQGGRSQREGGKGQLWAVAGGQQRIINIKYDEVEVIIMTKITSFISTRP